MSFLKGMILGQYGNSHTQYGIQGINMSLHNKQKIYNLATVSMSFRHLLVLPGGLV